MTRAVRGPCQFLLFNYSCHALMYCNSRGYSCTSSVPRVLVVPVEVLTLVRAYVSSETVAVASEKSYHPRFLAGIVAF